MKLLPDESLTVPVFRAMTLYVLKADNEFTSCWGFPSVVY
jgi:hypothetical protein